MGENCVMGCSGTVTGDKTRTPPRFFNMANSLFRRLQKEKEKSLLDFLFVRPIHPSVRPRAKENVLNLVG